MRSFSGPILKGTTSKFTIRLTMEKLSGIIRISEWLKYREDLQNCRGKNSPEPVAKHKSNRDGLLGRISMVSPVIACACDKFASILCASTDMNIKRIFEILYYSIRVRVLLLPEI